MLSTSRIQVTDTHHGAEALGKGLLIDMTGVAWSSVAVVFEPLLHGFPQFGVDGLTLAQPHQS